MIYLPASLHRQSLTLELMCTEKQKSSIASPTPQKQHPKAQSSHREDVACVGSNSGNNLRHITAKPQPQAQHSTNTRKRKHKSLFLSSLSSPNPQRNSIDQRTEAKRRNQ